MLIKKNSFGDLMKECEVLEEDLADPSTGASQALSLNSSGETIKPTAFNRDLLIEEAHKEAQEIIDNANKEAQDILDNVHQKVQEEVDKALIDKNRRLDELERKAITELEGLLSVEQNLVQESKTLIADLAVALASKILNKQVKEDNSILEKLVQETVDEMFLNNENNIKINLLVHASDLEAAQKFADRISKKSEKLEISARSDETVMKGSCIIETSSGAIDLNFATQLQLFKERFLLSDEI